MSRPGNTKTTEQDTRDEIKMKPIICIDFDGVLNNYTHYDKDDLFEPRPGAEQFLQKLSKKYTVIILSARRYTKIMVWLKEHGLLEYVAEVTSIKPPAHVYLDDRAVQFNGDYDKALKDIRRFKPYWKKEG